MNKNDLAKTVHDLRSPLARAKTLVKLLREARGVEGAKYTAMLEEALNDLDARLSQVEKANESNAS